jgi:hypothetical protein
MQDYQINQFECVRHNELEVKDNCNYKAIIEQYECNGACKQYLQCAASDQVLKKLDVPVGREEIFKEIGVSIE